MKHIANPLLILLIPLLGLFSSCNKDDEVIPLDPWSDVSSLPKEPLSIYERESLAFMREEEKLARDVYLNLYQKWGATIFQNIASSEQTHMDAVLVLLKKYSLPDPVGSNGSGVFVNSDLQEAYQELVNFGNQSLLNAYIVGATIEDLDIYDISDALELVDNADIKLVYNRLMDGSENHLVSFYKSILNAGGTYTPQFITQEQFDAIVGR